VVEGRRGAAREGDAAPLELMFEGLSSRDRERLEKSARQIRLAAGDVLMTEGDPATELYLVDQGSLEISRAGDEAVVKLGLVEDGEILGEVSFFDRGPRSATARALGDCRVTAIPFTAIEKLSDEGRAEVLRRAGEELSGRMRLGGDASAMAARRARALGQFVVSVMTLQCVYAIALTALPFLDGVLPASTSYVSIPLQLLFGIVAVAFIAQTRLPLRVFGIGFRDLVGSLALAVVVTLPFLGIVTLVKWIIIVAKGSKVPVVESLDFARLFDDGRIRTLFIVYVLSCLVQELIVRSALQASLHLFLTGKYARWRAVAVCALVFATNHLHMSALFAAVALLPGLVWGWMFDKKRNLAGVVVSHAIVGTWVFFLLGVNVG
jgi:CRP-like cAMP-binding protein